MAQSRAISTSLSAILAKVEAKLEGVKEQFLIEVAEDLVAQETSPVWSGHYITSHSISSTSSGGQFTANLGGWTDKTSNPEAYRSEARANLLGDIAALPKDADRVYISNNAPHAMIVEFGGGRTPAYGVFSSVANRASIHLQKAISKVKGGQ
jgi:hypothetical protein